MSFGKDSVFIMLNWERKLLFVQSWLISIIMCTIEVREVPLMPTSSIFTNVKITDPKKAEAFINALDVVANAPYERKERKESHILTDHAAIRRLMSKRIVK